MIWYFYLFENVLVVIVRYNDFINISVNKFIIFIDMVNWYVNILIEDILCI